MSSKDFIPRPDREFKAWEAKFLKHAALLIDKLGIHADDLEALDKLNDGFVAAFDIADDPETRTTSAILNKTNARKELEAEMRAFVRQYVAGNRALSDADRNDLGVHIPLKSRTPSPDPTTVPGFKVNSGTLRCLTIEFFDSESEHRAKPPGVHGGEIRWALLATPPTKMDELSNSAFDTHTPHTFEFDEDQRGKTVYFAMRWENTRGVKGHWSEIVSAIVP